MSRLLARGGLCFVGERPGDEGALFCNEGWLIGLEEGSCIGGTSGDDCCLTGERDRGGWDVPTPLVVGIGGKTGRALLCGGDREGPFLIGDGGLWVDLDDPGRWRSKELRYGFWEGEGSFGCCEDWAVCGGE